MIDWVAWMPQIVRAVALLEDEDDDPVGGRERDQVEERRLEGSTTDRNARASRISVRMSTNASTYGKFP